jgi:hypothetical protein
MSETAARPWWADVQHLRPGATGDSDARRAADSGRAGRFARLGAGEVPATAVATAVAIEEVPLLDEIDWHAFVDGHAELEESSFVPAEEIAPAPADADWGFEDVVPPARGADPLAALDWDVFEVPSESRRRTVEIRGQVDRAATAPVDAEIAPRSRRRPASRRAERLAGRPDRVAMWAFIMGVLLMLVAAISSPEAEAATRLLAG